MSRWIVVCNNCGGDNDMLEHADQATDWACSSCGTILVPAAAPIDLDQTIYEVRLEPLPSPTADQIRAVAKATNVNLIQARARLIEGDVRARGQARGILACKHAFEAVDLSVQISPAFSWS